MCAPLPVQNGISLIAGSAHGLPDVPAERPLQLPSGDQGWLISDGLQAPKCGLGLEPTDERRAVSWKLLCNGRDALQRLVSLGDPPLTDER